jgi:hypothetical protein
MKTLADEIYLSDALEALSRCVSEKDLVAFDDKFTSNEAYLHLPTAMIDRLEDEYSKRVAYVLGGLA